MNTKQTPIPNYLFIKRVNSHHGTTFFASKDIPKGHTICTTVLTNLDYQSGCIVTPLGDGFVHSENPNSKLRINKNNSSLIDVFTIDDILSGDEVTIKYENNKNKSMTRTELINQINLSNNIY